MWVKPGAYHRVERLKGTSLAQDPAMLGWIGLPLLLIGPICKLRRKQIVVNTDPGSHSKKKKKNSGLFSRRRWWLDSNPQTLQYYFIVLTIMSFLLARYSKAFY
jgi:hypothetical protein